MKNYSKQREEILEVLNHPGVHLTADEIFQKVKEIDSTISKGTVYRNLKDLVDERILWKISMKDGIMRYDYPKKKHNHVICSKCGIVKDFLYEFGTKKIIQSLKEQTDVDSDFETVTVYGVCDECKR